MNIDRLKKKQEENNARREGYRRDFWFPHEGMNTIRILPHWLADLDADCWCETVYHKNVGSDKKTVVCLKFQLKEECPVCELVDSLFKTKDKEDIAWAKRLLGKRRIYWNIVDLKALDKGVQVWMTGTDVQDQVIDYCTNPKWGDITHPSTGRNCDIKFTPKEKNKSGFNEIIVTPEPTISEIGDVQWLLKMIDLSTFIKITPVVEIVAMLSGEEEQVAPPTAVTTTEQKPVEQAPQTAVQTKTCIGKFSSDDSECLACVLKIVCQEKRAAKATGQATPAPAEASLKEAVKPEPLKSTSAKETEIQNMLSQIRNKAKKE